MEKWQNSVNREIAVKICFGSYLGQKASSVGNNGFKRAVLFLEKHFEVSDAFRSLLYTKIGRNYVT